MNDIFAPLYEPYFDYDYCSTLLDVLNSGREYTKIAILTLLVSIIANITFYKFIDPVRKQILKWFGFITILFIVGYLIANFIFNSNIDVMEYLANYDSDNVEISGASFRFQLSLINAVYSALITFLFSIGIKYISKTNKHNPF